MTRKALSEQTPRYRARIESAERRGKTHTQARGHGGALSEHQQKTKYAEKLGYKSRYQRDKIHKLVLDRLPKKMLLNKKMITLLMIQVDLIHGRAFVKGKPVVGAEAGETLQRWLHGAYQAIMRYAYA